MRERAPSAADPRLQRPSRRGSEDKSSAHRASVHSPCRLLFPREHGAWGMVSLPFLAGALVAGHWTNLRTVAAAVAVFSVFLVREPLLVLWRLRVANRKYGLDAGARAADIQKDSEKQNARLSLLVYGVGAIASGLYLLVSLPLAPLLLLGCGAGLLMAALLYFTVRNYQRHPVLQIAGVMGLTSSSLLSYLAGRGQWDEAAFWIWLLSAAHGSASVLVVHARLEAILAAKRPSSAATSDRRNAVVGQAGLGLLLGILAVTGRPWLVLPFLPPTVLHWLELWQWKGNGAPRVSLRWVGWLQLSASVVFCLLLVAALR